MKHNYLYIIAIVTCFLLHSCQQPGGDSTGSEFMPDMAHSIAYEANYYNYYYNNTWGSQEDYYKYAKPKEPVNGTIPRGSSANISIPGANSSAPYYYGNTEEERTRAMTEIIDNPLAITDAGLAQGKELYNVFCGICHGDKGDGNGYIYAETEAYPVAPKNLVKGATGNEVIDMEMINATNGRYYHAIMYGKNLMGGYSDKLNYEERWNVIHYIRSLQAKNIGVEYNQYSNTLNNVDRPAGEIVVAQLKEDNRHDHEHGGEHHDHDGDAHSDDKEGHGHDDDHSHEHDHDNKHDNH